MRQCKKETTFEPKFSRISRVRDRIGIYQIYRSGGSRISRGGREPRRRGCGLPRQLHFKNFVCQNERIGTLGGRAPGEPPLDPPMYRKSEFIPKKPDISTHNRKTINNPIVK